MFCVGSGQGKGDNRSAALWKSFLWLWAAGCRSVRECGAAAPSGASERWPREGSAACDIVLSALCVLWHRPRLFGFSAAQRLLISLDHSRPYIKYSSPSLKFMHRRARSCKERYTFAGINLPQDARRGSKRRGVFYLNIRMREREVDIGHLLQRPQILWEWNEFYYPCKIVRGAQKWNVHVIRDAPLRAHNGQDQRARLYFVFFFHFLCAPFETHFICIPTKERGINFFSCQRGNKCRSDCSRSQNSWLIYSCRLAFICCSFRFALDDCFA